MDVLSWITFVLIAALIVVIVVAVRRYWTDELNLSDDDIALEKRVARLNEGQANRRRDDEIVRLLSGDEKRVIGDDE